MCVILTCEEHDDTAEFKRFVALSLVENPSQRSPSDPLGLSSPIQTWFVC